MDLPTLQYRSKVYPAVWYRQQWGMDWHYIECFSKKYSCTLFEFPLGKTPGEDYSQNKLKIGKENINALTSESLSKFKRMKL